MQRLWFFEYESVKDNLIKYKCLSCNKDYSNKFDEELKKKLSNIFKEIQEQWHYYIYFVVKKRNLSLWIYRWFGKV